jgi:hypothetical protein
MTGWQPIATAPQETGSPLLLYPYPYPRRGWKTEARYPDDQLLIDVNDPTIRRMIKLVKAQGKVSKYEVDARLLRVLSPEQSKDLFNQLAQMEIEGVGETGAEKATEEGQPEDAAEREAAPDEEFKAPVTLASLLEGHWENYSNVFEGYWDGTRWLSAGGVPCEPTHWMHLPPPPLVLVQR